MKQGRRPHAREPWDPQAGDRRGPPDSAAQAERDAFARILTRVTRTSGFRIGDDTIQGLRTIIWERVHATGAGTAVEYLPLLDDPGEIDELHNAIAIRDTRFFRSPAQFWLLRDDVLPVLWLRRGSDTSLHLWSAGCASGEEAFSLAIVALDAAVRSTVSASPPVRILATDVNAEALATGEAAIYDDRALANVPADVRSRYFDRMGADRRVIESLRALVEFQRSSLLAPEWPVEDGSVDVLLCQSVLRFLPGDAQGATVERLCGALAPGGYLFLGRGEALPESNAQLELVQLPSASFYQKPLTAPPASRS